MPESKSNRDYYKERMDRQARERRADRRRRLAGVALGAAGLALAGGAFYEMNQFPPQVPDEVETGQVTLTPDATLRSDPSLPDITLTFDNQVSRDNLTYKGESLKDHSLKITNMLIITMPNGEKWEIVKGVKEDGQEKSLYVQMKDKGLEHPFPDAFADIFPDGNARLLTTGRIIPKTDFEQTEIVPAK